MVTAALVLAVAAAATGDGDLISGKVIVALFSAIFAAGGGIWIGRKGGESAAEKTWTKREQDLRTEIANELRMKIVNEPLSVEQSSYQAKMKENDKAHENLFNRMARIEQMHASLAAKVDAKFDAITEQLRETKDMVRQLFERICGGKKK